ncbi:MAG: ABC transporter permease, partial [Paracoccaceae bacterium]
MSQNSLWGRLSRSPAFNGYALISPTALYAVLLLAAPLATVVYLSFQMDGTGVREVIHQFNVQNYVTAWTDPIYRALMQRSLFVSFMVTGATVLLAFPVAYFISFYVSPSRKSLWLFLITIPFWT